MLKNDRLREIISYLPKVPTQPYEKEMAQRIQKLEEEIADLKQKLEASEAVIDCFYEATRKAGW